MSVGLDLPSAGGGTEARVQSPTSGHLSEPEEKHLRLKVKQMICGSLNGMRIRQSLAVAIHAPDRDAGPPKGTVARSWSLGILEQPQGKGCC